MFNTCKQYRFFRKRRDLNKLGHFSLYKCIRWEPWGKAKSNPRIHGEGSFSIFNPLLWANFGSRQAFPGVMKRNKIIPSLWNHYSPSLELKKISITKWMKKNSSAAIAITLSLDVPRLQACQPHVGTASKVVAFVCLFLQHSYPYIPKQDGVDLSANH